MNRRRLMLGEDRWAKEPLVIFDLSSGPVFGYVKMNGAYYLPSPWLPSEKQNSFNGMYGHYSLGHQDSIFLEDVTKYRKFVVTGKWERIPSEGTASIGFMKKENGDKFGGSYEIVKNVGPSSSQSTYTFDIKNLEGLQKFRMECNFVFSDDGHSTFQIIKMVLE